MARREAVVVSESSAQEAGAQLQARVEANRQTVAVTDGGTQDDYAPGGAAAWRRASVVYFDPSSDLTIGGFPAPAAADAVREKILINVSEFKHVTLANESGGSSASSRFLVNHENGLLLPGGGDDDGNGVAGGTCRIWYDDILSRWRLIDASNGLFITGTLLPSVLFRDTNDILRAVPFSVENNLLGRSAETGALAALPGWLSTPAIYLPENGVAPQVLSSTSTITYSVRLGLDAIVILNQSHAALNWNSGGGPLFPGQRGRLKLIQADGTPRTIASYTVNGVSNVIFPGGAPALTVGASAVDVFDWSYDGAKLIVIPHLNLT